MSYISRLATDLAIIAEEKSIKGAAAQAVLNGWKVLPVKKRNKLPHFDLIKRGHLDATDDWNLIDFWFSIDPQMNYGINCQPSGLLVLDIDFRNGGVIPEWALETKTISTGDGLHLYYNVDADIRFFGQVDEGIDIKYKGFVVGERSVHQNGKIYTAINDASIATLNDEMLERLAR
jgi:hypothetical protein